MKIKSLMAALLAVCLSLVIGIAPASAQQEPPPEGGPVVITVIPGPTMWSQDILSIFAEQSVREGTLKVRCRSLDAGYPGVSEVTVWGNGLDEVIQRLREQVLNFRVLNPDDYVEWEVALRDDLMSTLFYGWTTTPADVGVKPYVNLELSSVPALKGVRSAEALVLSPDGTTWERWGIWVREDGMLMLPGWMAGTPNVTVATVLEDGTAKTYRTGQPDPGQERLGQAGSAGMGVEDRYEFTNPPEVSMAVTSRPSFRFKVDERFDTKPLVTVFNVPGVTYGKGGVTTVEWPKALFIVRRITSDGVEGDPIPLDPMGPTKVVLPVGEYAAFMIWNKFGVKAPIPTGYGGPVGEKGL